MEKPPAPRRAPAQAGDAAAMEAELARAEEQTQQLIERIAFMEAEQRAARERIEHLSQAKIGFEQAIARIRAQKETSAQQQAANEKLLHELAEMVQRKEAEQLGLKEKVELIRVQAEKEIALLKAERDAAMAIVERRQTVFSGGNSLQMFLRRNINLVIIASSVMLVIIMLLAVVLIKLLSMN
jgi:septal ring factor EnvC (AmiA/AmiB activator)